MTAFPARIHVLLAQQAPIGLVIRRGPSKQVATLLWNRRTDQFQLGQWLKGRIYERRSDISPDGKYFIYFAMNGKWRSESKGSWTAISRAPYLKALVMIPFGDCWGGGGLWTSATHYWLNGSDKTLCDSNLIQRDDTYIPEGGIGAECLSVYYPRLLRNGWKLVQLQQRGTVISNDTQDIFDKSLSHGWILRKLAHANCNSPQGKGCYWDNHQLIHLRSNTTLDLPEWEWAEYDRHRLVWATEGKLFTSKIADQGLVNPTELYNFNSMTFKPIVAPY